MRYLIFSVLNIQVLQKAGLFSPNTSKIKNALIITPNQDKSCVHAHAQFWRLLYKHMTVLYTYWGTSVS